MKKLPKGFYLGAATVTRQVGGATKEGGRGQNMWDVYLAKYGQYSPDPASDLYHRYPEDIALAKEFGLSAIRLSISWVRLFPKIDDPVNESAVAYYHDLFKTYLDYGITPFVALHHFDSPQEMLKEGDWLSRKNIGRFIKYVKFCFLTFPEIKNWFTINELIPPAGGQYLGGQFPSNHHFNVSEAIQAEHNMLVAHTRAVITYHDLNLLGGIGCIHALKTGYSNSNRVEDIQACKRYDAYNNHLLPDGALLGEYQSETMQLLQEVLQTNDASLTILPEDLVILKKAALLNGMFGMNYYRSEFVREYYGESIDQFNSTGKRGISALKFKGVGESVKQPEVPTTGWDWNIYPRGLFDMSMRIKRDYPNVPTIFLTENDMALKEQLDKEKTVDDSRRIDFIDQRLEQVLEARQAGVNTQDYFVRSLQDQFSWANGYSKRYGLFYVDFEAQKRYPKKSAYWFK